MKYFIYYYFFVLILITLVLDSCKIHNQVSNNNIHDKTDSLIISHPNKNPSAIQIKYAEILKTTPEHLYNQQLYAFIDEWMGVKYKWGGMDKNGVDCSGFANVLYKEVYQYSLKRSAYDIIKDCNEIDKNQIMEGDFVFFDISSKNSHIGIYLANNKFVHASTSKGVMISDLNESYWLKYWGRAARIK